VLQELTALFARPDPLAQLMPAVSDAAAYPSLPSAFVHAWHAVEAIEALASFLFAAVAVPRPAGMTLAQFLRLGMTLRGQAGIDALERGLKLAPRGGSQEQLRNYAVQALRRTQQRLLQVLASSDEPGDTTEAAVVIANAMGVESHMPAVDLEQAILAAWSLSELSTMEVAGRGRVHSPRLADSFLFHYDELTVRSD
jgi:glutamate dehydrogenase